METRNERHIVLERYREARKTYKESQDRLKRSRLKLESLLSVSWEEYVKIWQDFSKLREEKERTIKEVTFRRDKVKRRARKYMRRGCKMHHSGHGALGSQVSEKGWNAWEKAKECDNIITRLCNEIRAARLQAEKATMVDATAWYEAHKQYVLACKEHQAVREQYEEACTQKRRVNRQYAYQCKKVCQRVAPNQGPYHILFRPGKTDVFFGKKGQKHGHIVLRPELQPDDDYGGILYARMPTDITANVPNNY